MTTLAGLNHSKSEELLQRNARVIPGGVVSLNRKVDPGIAFVRALGSRAWDVDGNEYIDYHAGFAPYLLGHNDPDVNAAVLEAIGAQQTLMGSGTTPWEGKLCELICECIPSAEKVQLTCSGSEATYHSIRLARTWTGKNGIVLMLGGYNGWHNDVARAVMPPEEATGPRQVAGEYSFVPLSAGIPQEVSKNIHTVNFNDLDSVEAVFKSNEIACLMTEPILQNIGIVKPEKGYLQGLRELCDQYGVLLIFDEVKTGFRHALGGYQSICDVKPDLSCFGKAIANGYPMGAITGRSDIMDLFVSSDPKRKVLIAGTYNGHPMVVAAAIRTIEKLQDGQLGIYDKLEALGAKMQTGLTRIFRDAGIVAFVERQGSAFCSYFMDHSPKDWHDVRENHDFKFDKDYRSALIEAGVYHFPLPTKQGSISAAHTDEDVEQTLAITAQVVADLLK